MMRLQKLMLVAAAAGAFAACKKDSDPVIVIPPSSGAQVQLNGLVGTEAGSSAGNAVFLDLSTDKQTALARASWDLGFYSGSDFRVILNNTASAGAKVLTKNDLTAVGASDTVGLTLATSQTAPSSDQLAYFDDIAGDLTKNVIPAVSATDADNKVIILNRGTGGSIPARAWVKLRVLRNASGYTLQYAGIQETTFKTLSIAKDDLYHFKLVSIDNGVLANGFPEKDKWDITWSYSVFQTDFGGGMVPYNFSDLIAVNYLAGVTVAQKQYYNSSSTAKDSATVASAAYAAFNKDSVAKTTFVTGRWTIGSNWRSTQPATGARLDRIYIIKDAAGNYYKLRCLSMGVGSDGGTRGKPEFKYELISK
ncbi:MAG: HmuY family protein [Chitinophagaceae bacterium]